MIKSLFRKIKDLLKKIGGKISKNENLFVSTMYLEARQLKRSISGSRFNFVSVEDLMLWTENFIKTIPSSSFDVIVGIPRSGLLVANIIALKLGKPLTTPEHFIKQEVWKSKLMPDKSFKNVLLVDDSVTSGVTLQSHLKNLQSLGNGFNIKTAAIITTEIAKAKVDFYYKILEHPRVFEWNLLHSKKGKTASDLDGVICENCPPYVDADEEKYLSWLRNAKPYLIPNFELDAIVSSRLNKYRSITEEWLAKHGVKYSKLFLWDLPSKSERKGKHAQNKVEILLKIKPNSFWESSEWEAREIFRKTRIPTLCIDEMILLS
jgi:adenine/guanine phosphoribosyltransferase-like PRPP-binding protein